MGGPDLQPCSSEASWPQGATLLLLLFNLLLKEAEDKVPDVKASVFINSSDDENAEKVGGLCPPASLRSQLLPPSDGARFIKLAVSNPLLPLPCYKIKVAVHATSSTFPLSLIDFSVQDFSHFVSDFYRIISGLEKDQFYTWTCFKLLIFCPNIRRVWKWGIKAEFVHAAKTFLCLDGFCVLTCQFWPDLNEMFSQSWWWKRNTF